MFYRIFIRPVLFLFAPETVHHLVAGMLKFPPISKLLKLIYAYEHPSLHQTISGLTFSNPVGLAAGFDKEADLYPHLADLGFGFIEIGTVTPRPQPGNPTPRIFRLPADQALINRMGFNNRGVRHTRQNLQRRKSGILIGGNIGKNKTTPNEQSMIDYEDCFNELYPVVDFLIVNVSSPNTPHLRELQEREPLQKLLTRLKELVGQHDQYKPLFLKIAPDLNESQLDEVLAIVRETGTDGIVATNTTISREGLRTPASRVAELGDGGLSGQPLRQRSTEIIRYLRRKAGPELIIIGVGGIHSAQDAIEKLQAGANLIELYTGFIYQGPALVKSIKKELKKSGFPYPA